MCIDKGLDFNIGMIDGRPLSFMVNGYMELHISVFFAGGIHYSIHFYAKESFAKKIGFLEDEARGGIHIGFVDNLSIDAIGRHIEKLTRCHSPIKRLSRAYEDLKKRREEAA